MPAESQAECMRSPAGPMYSPDSSPDQPMPRLDLGSSLRDSMPGSESEASPVLISTIRKNCFSPDVKRVADC